MPSATTDPDLRAALGELPTLPPVASPAELERLYALFGPLRALFRPTFDGWANIPTERPLLFVGNHTLYGVIDSPHLFFELHRREGIFLRSLGDHAHWAIPGWRELLSRFGAVDGTPENCAAIFASGGSVLVFPGGAREAFKSPAQRYQLLWGKRLGFARMALLHRVTIVPFAALGADEIFDIALDKGALQAGPLGGLIEALRVREDLIPPLPRLSRSALPRPQRLYFRFCPPVHTRQYGGAVTDEAATAVRDETKAAIEGALDDLHRLRESDPMADLSRWVGRRLGEGLSRFIPKGGGR
jgi:1-acyl-sn-glycerol-3-phosphate acyltransferase